MLQALEGPGDYLAVPMCSLVYSLLSSMSCTKAIMSTQAKLRAEASTLNGFPGFRQKVRELCICKAELLPDYG